MTTWNMRDERLRAPDPVVWGLLHRTDPGHGHAFAASRPKAAPACWDLRNDGHAWSPSTDRESEPVPEEPDVDAREFESTSVDALDALEARVAALEGFGGLRATRTLAHAMPGGHPASAAQATRATDGDEGAEQRQHSCTSAAASAGRPCDSCWAECRALRCTLEEQQRTIQRLEAELEDRDTCLLRFLATARPDVAEWREARGAAAALLAPSRILTGAGAPDVGDS